MAIAPVLRESVSDIVFAGLVDEILSGRIAAGDPLPAERQLAESFQVNRHAVREALKRIRQVGLIKISQGGKTQVLNWRVHAGLDLLVELARIGVVPPAKVLHDVAEMRCSVGADAVRACAERADDQTLARITEAAQRYPDESADIEFWEAVIDGSGNLAYRLGLNTLVAAIDDLGVDRFAGLAEEVADRDTHVRLAALIVERNGDEARRVAEDLMSGVVSLLAKEL
jgi:GntR family transcriptional regulator, transcriptional repressor for pyruvate dehydrogenase complex